MPRRDVQRRPVTRQEPRQAQSTPSIAESTIHRVTQAKLGPAVDRRAAVPQTSTSRWAGTPQAPSGPGLHRRYLHREVVRRLSRRQTKRRANTRQTRSEHSKYISITKLSNDAYDSSGRGRPGRAAERPGASWLARCGLDWLDLAARDAQAGSI